MVAFVTVPAESILPKAMVNTFVLFKSLTLSNVWIVANCCKFFVSAVPVPAVTTNGGPLNLTTSPALLWWSCE